MAEETAKIFHMKLMADKDLQTSLLNECYETDKVPDRSGHAKVVCGLDLSPEEASAYLTPMESEEYEPGEFELELVAAAGSPVCIDS